MDLKLIRKYFSDDYTIGHLYVNGKYFCDTLENEDKLLHEKMPLKVLDRVKTAGKTAIPIGVYQINMNTISPKYKALDKYSDIEFKLPRLEKVPMFEGILIHIGNYSRDTLGCILVGKNTIKGAVMESTLTFNALYKLLRFASDANEDIWISIEYEDWEMNILKK